MAAHLEAFAAPAAGPHRAAPGAPALAACAPPRAPPAAWRAAAGAGAAACGALPALLAVAAPRARRAPRRRRGPLRLRGSTEPGAAGTLLGPAPGAEAAPAAPAAPGLQHHPGLPKQLCVVPDEGTNYAFMYLKPHANTPRARDFVLEQLSRVGVQVRKEGEISGEKIQALGLIDTHYGSLATKALRQDPVDLIVQSKAQEAFHAAFGLHWQDALARGLVCNASGALQRLKCTAEELEARWAPLQLGEGKVKFGGGCYCGKIGDLYVINGFYMVMRAMYTQPRSSIHWFSLDWPSKSLSWKAFRRSVLGGTDPARAEPGSLRAGFHRRWRDLGLPGVPHVGENAVHASASPMEALFERLNWLQIPTAEDPFGKILQKHCVRTACLQRWASDPAVEHEGGLVSLFDLFEDRDTAECLDLARRLQRDGGPER